MAFDPFSLTCSVDSIAGGSLRIFFYRTGDSEATVTGNWYFANGADRGMRRHDIVMVLTTQPGPAGELYITKVDAVDGSGNASVVIPDSQLGSLPADVAALQTAFAGLNKASVGLGNVDNTSDANKPVSTAQQAALDALPFLPVTIAPADGLTVKQTSVTQVAIAATSVVLFTAGGVGKKFSTLSETLAITASGANGLDTGSEASSTWYHIWAIGKADGTLDGLLSTSPTGPTLPSGYTYKGYLGAVYNDGSSNFLAFSQKGRVAIAAGRTVQSGLTATTATLVDLSAYVPPTAIEATLHPIVYKTAGTALVTGSLIADSGGIFYIVSIAHQAALATGQASYNGNTVQAPMLTAQSVWYLVSGTSAAMDVICRGWRF